MMTTTMTSRPPRSRRSTSGLRRSPRPVARSRRPQPLPIRPCGARSRTPSTATPADRPNPMAKVAVLFTGGTISMRHDPAAGGNVPVLGGRDILALVPGLDELAEVVPLDLGLTPASHFTFPALFAIRAAIDEALADLAVDGAVVVQGTDTIEETAFFFDLLHADPRPLVVTGAMRTSHAPDYDGPANLRDAVAAAASPDLREAGAVVVLAGSIEPADDVTKTHTTAFD